MSLPLESLDDRRFEDLFEEARALLPRFAPEWTDHNTSDPGITLIELFAWLFDTQFYRLDQVSERQREAFARLLGLRRREAVPARVLLWPSDGTSVSSKLVAAGTLVNPRDRARMPFETVRDTFLTGAVLVSVRTFIGDACDEQLDANVLDNTRFFPFGRAPRPGNALELEFKPGFAEPFASLWFQLADEELPEPALEEADSLPPIPSATIAWEWSHDASTWAPLALLEDRTRDLARSGAVVFRVPAGSAERLCVRARLQRGSYEISPELWCVDVNVLECRQVGSLSAVSLGVGTGEVDQELDLDPFVPDARALWLVEALERGFGVARVAQDQWAAFLDELFAPDAAPFVAYVADAVRSMLGTASIAPDDDGARFECAWAIERALEARRVLYAARADGRLAGELFGTQLVPSSLAAASAAAQARERFVRAFSGLLQDDRFVLSTPGQTWTEVADLGSSGPNAAHFTFDRARRRIRFGNGINGRLPPRGSQLALARARTCRGSAGNLDGLHTWTVDAAAGIFGTYENPWSASGGRDRESIAELLVRMRAHVRKLRRLVTVGDAELLARATPGLRVARAQAIFGCSPEWPAGVDLPGEVCVTVVPHARREDRMRPPPASAGFLATVERHLESRRLLGDRVRVRAARYVDVTVECVLVIQENADAARAESCARQRIDRHLAPLSLDEGGQHGWEFGRNVRAWKLRAELDELDEVEFVESLALRCDQPGATAEEVPLATDELPRVGVHTIRVRVARAERAWSGSEGAR